MLSLILEQPIMLPMFSKKMIKTHDPYMKRETIPYAWQHFIDNKAPQYDLPIYEYWF